MLLVYKLLNGFTQSDWRQFFRRNINNTRGHKDKLYKPVVTTNLKLNSFSNRIINGWNKLPEEVIKVEMKCFFLFPNLKEQQKSGRSPFTVS